MKGDLKLGPAWLVAKPVDVQLLRRAIRADIASVEPDLVSNLKWGCGLRMSVVVLLILLLGMLQVVTKDLMELAELLDEGFGGRIN